MSKKSGYFGSLGYKKLQAEHAATPGSLMLMLPGGGINLGPCNGLNSELIRMTDSDSNLKRSDRQVVPMGYIQVHPESLRRRTVGKNTFLSLEEPRLIPAESVKSVQNALEYSFSEYTPIEPFRRGGTRDTYKGKNGSLRSVVIKVDGSPQSANSAFNLAQGMNTSHELDVVLSHIRNSDNLNFMLSAKTIYVTEADGTVRPRVAAAYEHISDINLEDRVLKSGPLQPITFIHYFNSALASVLDLNRDRVYHNDIKPENFIVHPNELRLVLTDFANASYVDSAQSSVPTIRGSRKTTDPLIDKLGNGAEAQLQHQLYALAKTGLFMLTGFYGAQINSTTMQPVDAESAKVFLPNGKINTSENDAINNRLLARYDGKPLQAVTNIIKQMLTLDVGKRSLSPILKYYARASESVLEAEKKRADPSGFIMSTMSNLSSLEYYLAVSQAKSKDFPHRPTVS